MGTPFPEPEQPLPEHPVYKLLKRTTRKKKEKKTK